MNSTCVFQQFHICMTTLSHQLRICMSQTPHTHVTNSTYVRPYWVTNCTYVRHQLHICTNILCHELHICMSRKAPMVATTSRCAMCMLVTEAYHVRHTYLKFVTQCVRDSICSWLNMRHITWEHLRRGDWVMYTHENAFWVVSHELHMCMSRRALVLVTTFVLRHPHVREWVKTSTYVFLVKC